MPERAPPRNPKRQRSVYFTTKNAAFAEALAARNGGNFSMAVNDCLAAARKGSAADHAEQRHRALMAKVNALSEKDRFTHELLVAFAYAFLVRFPEPPIDESGQLRKRGQERFHRLFNTVFDCLEQQRSLLDPVLEAREARREPRS